MLAPVLFNVCVADIKDFIKLSLFTISKCFYNLPTLQGQKFKNVALIVAQMKAGHKHDQTKDLKIKCGKCIENL